jgi:hypothetical protein
VFGPIQRPSAAIIPSTIMANSSHTQLSPVAELGRPSGSLGLMYMVTLVSALYAPHLRQTRLGPRIVERLKS